jgi:hypothetical protein
MEEALPFFLLSGDLKESRDIGQWKSPSQSVKGVVPQSTPLQHRGSLDSIRSPSSPLPPRAGNVYSSATASPLYSRIKLLEGKSTAALQQVHSTEGLYVERLAGLYLERLSGLYVQRLAGLYVERLAGLYLECLSTAAPLPAAPRQDWLVASTAALQQVHSTVAGLYVDSYSRSINLRSSGPSWSRSSLNVIIYNT